MTIILFIIVFGVLVFAHEMGHFLLAKANGIHVVEFGIGMGPKLIHFTKGDTLYALRLLPIGGACIFENQDGLEEKNGTPSEGSFQNASVWAKISTVFAGPFFNFLLAYLLALILVAFTGSDKPVILGTMDGYPAQEAGIQTGDVITKMNGGRIYVAREIYINTFLNEGNPMTLEYVRDGKTYTTTVQPQYNEEEGRYLIGLQGYGEKVDCKNLSIFKYSYYEVRYSMISTFKSLKMVIQGKAGKDAVSGPIGIAQVIGEVKDEAAPYGIGVVILNMMNIALLLSVNLGIVNLLPLPALDGGRLVFLLIEAIRGKPVPPEKEGVIHFAGFVALMILMVFVMYNDIMRLFA